MLRVCLVGLAGLLVATLSSEAVALSLSRGPYLQSGTSTSVIVRWRTDVPANSRVRAGIDPTNLNLTFEVGTITTEHEVPVSGLNPQTKYYYSIGSTTQELSRGDNTSYFYTAPVPGTGQPTRIWVIGDAGTGWSGQAAVYDAYRKFTGSHPTHLWLMLGDNAYKSGTDDQYQAQLFEMYPDMFRQSVVWPAFGNHDGVSADSVTQTGPYYDIFSLPKNGEAGGVPSGTEAYYAFDYANIHFVVLDSHESSRDPRGPMLSWLRTDLQATKADWVVAYWHHPPYTKGSHDSDTERQLIEIRHHVVPVLEELGVDLVLAGHSHSYERSKFIDGHYGSSATFNNMTHIKQMGDGRGGSTGAYTKPRGRAAHSGTVYAAIGSSGKLSGGSLNHPAMSTSLKALGSLVLDVDGLILSGKFLDEHGIVRDYFTISKASDPP